MGPTNDCSRFRVNQTMTVTPPSEGDKIIIIEDEENINFDTLGDLQLQNCNYGDISAEKATLDNCQDFDRIFAKEIKLKKCTVRNAYAGEQVNINKSEITNLQFSLDSKIKNSRVESILVNPNCGKRETSIREGRAVAFPLPNLDFSPTNIYLINTIVNDIKFTGEKGSVVLVGKSKVRGKVINGNIERLNF